MGDVQPVQDRAFRFLAELEAQAALEDVELESKALPVAEQEQPDIAPDDEPKPGDVCGNCEGRGYVGDGTVRTRCQPCDGGGRVK